MEVSDEFDCDVIAVVSDGERLVVNLAMVRGGRHLGDRSFFSSTGITAGLEGKDVLAEALFNFIIEHYKSGEVPRTIIVNQQSVVSEIHSWIGTENNQFWKNLEQSKFLFSPKEPYKDWLKMAENNAKSALMRRGFESDASEEKTSELLKFFDFSLQTTDAPNFRIECFDVSHMSGESTYCSCVVFQNFTMQPSQYRRFSIKEITGGDDYAALKQALERRYRDKNNLPNIALIDGGKGQLNVLKNVFQGLGITTVLCASIVKGEGRKVGLEKLILSDNRVLTFENNKSVLMTLARIRDEAHRFAIAGMRAKKSKDATRSVLDEIEGIGPKRRKALLSRFGGLQGLKRASEAELGKVNGISHDLSKKIFSYFN
jgi:excinuclease ABC subunit C